MLKYIILNFLFVIFIIKNIIIFKIILKVKNNFKNFLKFFIDFVLKIKGKRINFIIKIKNILRIIVLII